MSSEQFKQGILNTNGIEIHYVEKGEGPLVLFVMVGQNRGIHGGIRSKRLVPKDIER